MAKKAYRYISLEYSTSAQDINFADFFSGIDIAIDNGAIANDNIVSHYISNEGINNDKISSTGETKSEYDYWAPMDNIFPNTTPVSEPVKPITQTITTPGDSLNNNAQDKPLSKKELAKKQKEESKKLRAALRREKKNASQDIKINSPEAISYNGDVANITDSKPKEKFTDKLKSLLTTKIDAPSKDVKVNSPETTNYNGDVANITDSKPKEKFTDKLKSLLTTKIDAPSIGKKAQNKAILEGEALHINYEGEDAVKNDVKVLYEYIAKDSDGKTVKGYFEAYSKVEVHSYLLSEGYEVYSIRTSKWIQFLYGGSKVNTTKVRIKDLIFFLTQLSTYIKAGIPLVESLKILSRQFHNKAYKRIFEGLIYDLTMGDSFSEALSKQNEAFPKLLINMIKASEMTGELPEALDDMADYYTEIDKTRRQMITAMMYPTIIFVIAIAVMTFIMLFVIPKFVQIYESMDNAAIPQFTLTILGISEFMQNYALWIFIAVIILCFMFAYLYKTVKNFRLIVQNIVMRLPVFGNVVIYNEVTMFTKTFASLLSHNVFITDSMDILNKLTNNEIYKSLILDTITNLAKGEKISTSFKDHWAFPIPAYEMIVTGERTGQLSEMMAKVSSYYQELHSNAVTRIKTFVEPVLIIFLTVMVGIIVLAIVIPMFNMYSAIQA